MLLRGVFCFFFLIKQKKESTIILLSEKGLSSKRSLQKNNPIPNFFNKPFQEKNYLCKEKKTFSATSNIKINNIEQEIKIMGTRSSF
jgi:hypothetical protein